MTPNYNPLGGTSVCPPHQNPVSELSEMVQIMGHNKCFHEENISELHPTLSGALPEV